jgi:hypothetical protein
MRFLSACRAALVALVSVAAIGLTSAAHADSGTVRISVIKGGWVIGGTGGGGSLTFRGRRYPLSIGGVSWGLTFGAAKTDLTGRVSNIQRASDVAGVYGAVSAGVAVGGGAQVIELRNEKGAVLSLTGRQVGLLANVDLNGLAISLR